MKKVKESRFPYSLFAIYFGVLLLMSGIHMGLVVLGNERNWGSLISTAVPVVYWGLVAAALTLFTRNEIRKNYEKPMHELAEAARMVAGGDFSVYVPPLHTPDRLDYMDVMVMDFNKMVEELGSIETLKTDFVSNVSHEMKTPISIIKNYAELLQMESVSESCRLEYAKSMEEAAVKLSDLISNILRLNKLEHQTITPKLQTYDVCRQLCDCILHYEDTWEAKSLELEVEMDNSALIRADESLLEIVWNNLMSNAVKFTEPGGTISIRQIVADGNVIVSVSDTGCGMSQESMKHIFDKFYQGDTSHSSEGNGLGLALVRRVLQLLDGNIGVASEEGRGSTFTVTLPMAEAADSRNEMEKKDG